MNSKMYSLCLLERILLQGWFSNFMLASESCSRHFKEQIAGSHHQFLIRLVWGWAQAFVVLTSSQMLPIFRDM